jgi:hypothetical protein
MQAILFLLVLTLGLGPCILAGWIASFLRQPVLAFFAAWLLTPLIAMTAVLMAIPALRALTPPGNDGTEVIMIPIFGIVSGFIAGLIVAARARPRAPTAIDKHNSA